MITNGSNYYTRTEPLPRSTITELISDILGEARTLMQQQVALFRAEIREETKRTTNAAKYLGIGMGLGAIGGLFLLIGLVNLFAFLVPTMPMWGCWMIVGGTLFLGGLVGILIGQNRFRQVSPIPQKSINALQENIKWFVKRQN